MSQQQQDQQTDSNTTTPPINNDNHHECCGNTIQVDPLEKWSHWPTTQPLQSPLSFQLNKKKSDQKAVKYPCLQCEYFDYDSRSILEHLFYTHKIVISEVNSVANLSSYLDFWRKKMHGKPITEYTSCIQTQPTQDQPVTNYYLLSDILPEDQELRRELQTERLGFVLDQQHLERSDPNFSSTCPMCSTEFRGDRSAVALHLFEQHNFNIGLSDNLVNINELLDIMREKIEANQCLFCEKIFKSSMVLKLHMKKKKHLRLNPMNTIYDRFYLLNYLEPGKTWEELKKEDEDEEQTTNNIEMLKLVYSELNGTHTVTQWDDWTENSDEEPEDHAVCLFCPNHFEDSELAFDHLEKVHKFDFEKIRKDWNLDYYDCMKVLNFIRRQVYQSVCSYCGDKFESSDKVYKHFQEHVDHCGVVPHNPIWRDPQYLFPTFENDSILRNFEEFDEEEDNMYREEEEKYQSELINEMRSTRDEILKKMNDAKINLN
eukprot:gene8634-10626_t